jgi:formylglycine-generating enzyme required for sulfatase activity
MIIRFLLILGVFLGCASTQAQTVSAVTATQQGNELVISYALSSEVPCDVSLFVSLNEGKSWTGPLVHVSGDVGKNVSAGNRSIRWQVLEEQSQLVGSNILFKVTASGKNVLEPEMVFVQGGTFQMGSNLESKDERPLHSVTLSDFYIGKYEITQAQWMALMGENPSKFVGCDDCPVEQVSWSDVQSFISKLNKQTGKRYRLPTEAEWEYAAGGGSQSQGSIDIGNNDIGTYEWYQSNEGHKYTYSGSNNIGEVAWFSGNSGNTTHVVGALQPNELGIYDMTGNVGEWCSDWDGAYNSQHATNPNGAFDGWRRICRGGSWGHDAIYCHTRYRYCNPPHFSLIVLGFRLVLEAAR